MAHPSPLERSYQPKDGSAPFFQDLCNWRRIPAFRAFIYESPAAELAARLMGSATSAPFMAHRRTHRPSLDGSFQPGGSDPMRASCGVVHWDRRHFLI